jgi:hypothetical protein
MDGPMAAESSNTRKDRLAAALKENLKRRKAQARAKATRAEADMPRIAKGPGTAPRADLDERPDAGLKSALKRN